MALQPLNSKTPLPTSRPNIFTDTSPTFPYQSTEASSTLGIPDSPEIHLAITALAERLLLVAEQAGCEDRIKRITLLRQVSGVVLNRLPFVCAELELRVSLEISLTNEDYELAYKTQRTDWLGQAVAQLKSEGIETRPSFRKQATLYGWVEPQ